MIYIEPRDLPEAATQALECWQAEIDGLPSYEQRVAEGKQLFRTRNRATNRVFAEVRRVLDEMCSGPRRCGYCEDSLADEVEHVRPKDLYPDSVFCWTNYLYACGTCNGPKNNKYAVFGRGSTPIVISRTRHDPIVPPRAGDPVFVDPRAEDPLDYIYLDLLGTFHFVPAADEGTRAYQRGKYTIDVLRLNRPALAVARRNAYSAYRARLREYICIADEGGADEDRRKCAAELRISPHATVWREMQRQAPLHEELAALFRRAPEALRW